MTGTKQFWAAQGLGVEPGSDAVAAKAAFLAHLETEGFLPSESVVAAWNERADQALPLSRTARHDETQTPHSDFDDFLTNYWKLATAERQDRWEHLRGRYPTGHVAVRLVHLRHGLQVASATEHADARVNAFAAAHRELFLMPPRSRAIRRHEWLESAGDWWEWVQAVRTLEETEPLVLDLDPPLSEWVERNKGAKAIEPSTAPIHRQWGDEYEPRGRSVQGFRT